MDLLATISSLNKIGVIFFFVTLCVLIYEIIAFKREKTGARTVIHVPDFDSRAKPEAPRTVTVASPVKSSEAPDLAPIPVIPKKNTLIPIIITSLVLIVVGGITLLTYLFPSRPRSTATGRTASPTPQTRVLRSEGVDIYDTSWKLLNLNDLKTLPPGTRVYVGIHTVPSADIDQARIRVNEDEWTEGNVTADFYAPENVYYIEYTIPPDTPSFRVEAQLHSVATGWPAEQQ